MANRRASERQAANSKSAGINLRRVRSPEAPKITIVQGSATATELRGSGATVSAISFVTDAIGSSSYKRRPDATLRQVSAQLLGRTKENRRHPHLFGWFQICWTVVYKDAFLGSALRDAQCKLIDQWIGLARAQVAGSKEGREVPG